MRRRRCSRVWWPDLKMWSKHSRRGRYYFNFKAPCSLPILFSAAWYNNKCYLDPYLVRGRNGPGVMFHLSTRPRPISCRCLWDFLSRAEPGQSRHWGGTYLFVTMSYEFQIWLSPEPGYLTILILLANLMSRPHWHWSLSQLISWQTTI